MDDQVTRRSDDNKSGWDGTERRRHQQPAGFALNSWSAVQSLMTILVVLFGGIAWGLKLESRIDLVARDTKEAQRISEEELRQVSAQLSRGILPIAAIRIETIEERLKGLSQTVDECIKRSPR